MAGFARVARWSKMRRRTLRASSWQMYMQKERD